MYWKVKKFSLRNYTRIPDTATWQETGKWEIRSPIGKRIRNACNKSTEDNKKPHQRQSDSSRRAASKLLLYCCTQTATGQFRLVVSVQDTSMVYSTLTWHVKHQLLLNERNSTQETGHFSPQPVRNSLIRNYTGIGTHDKVWVLGPN